MKVVEVPAEKANIVKKITHNNDRVHYTIAIDVAKEGTEIWDLTPYFKARVGDSNASLDVTWYRQGRIESLENARPYIEGNSGKYFVDDNGVIQLEPGASVVTFHGNPEDMGGGGRATYRFPPEMFPQDGIFKGFIGIENDLGQVSGVTIWFKVLPGIARMGHAKQVYIDQIEQMKLEFAAEQRAKMAEFSTAVDNIKQQMNSDYQESLEKHNKDYDDEMASINEKLDEANHLAKGIADANNTLSEAVDANSEAVRNGLAPTLNRSNVFTATNTFNQTAAFQNGATFFGTVLINGIDLAQLVKDIEDLKKKQGGN